MVGLALSRLAIYRDVVLRVLCLFFEAAEAAIVEAAEAAIHYSLYVAEPRDVNRFDKARELPILIRPSGRSHNLDMACRHCWSNMLMECFQRVHPNRLVSSN